MLNEIKIVKQKYLEKDLSWPVELMHRLEEKERGLSFLWTQNNVFKYICRDFCTSHLNWFEWSRTLLYMYLVNTNSKQITEKCQKINDRPRRGHIQTALGQLFAALESFFKNNSKKYKSGLLNCIFNIFSNPWSIDRIGPLLADYEELIKSNLSSQEIAIKFFLNKTISSKSIDISSCKIKGNSLNNVKNSILKRLESNEFSWYVKLTEELESVKNGLSLKWAEVLCRRILLDSFLKSNSLRLREIRWLESYWYSRRLFEKSQIDVKLLEALIDNIWFESDLNNFGVGLSKLLSAIAFTLEDNNKSYLGACSVGIWQVCGLKPPPKSLIDQVFLDFAEIYL